MFACVTSGLTTPGVRARSAAYGPLECEPVGSKYAAVSKSNVAAMRSARNDMQRRCACAKRSASCPNGARPSESVATFDNVLTTDQKGAVAELAIARTA